MKKHNTSSYSCKKGGQPSILKNSASNYVALFVSTIVHFLLTPFLIKHLGKDLFGAWILIGSVILYYGLLDLGVSSAIINYVAKFIGQKDETGINQTVNSALAILCVMAVVIIILSFLIAGPLSHFFKVSTEHLFQFSNAIFLMALGFSISLIGGVFYSALRGFEKFRETNIVNIGTSIFRAAFMVLALFMGKGLIGIAFAVFITQLTGTCVLYIFCKRLLPSIHFRQLFIKTYMVRKLIFFGASTTLIEIAFMIRFNLDSIVIGKILNLSAVGVYAIAGTLMIYFMKLITAFTQVLLPRLSKYHGSGEKVKFESTFFRSMRIVSIMTCAVGLIFFLAGKAFIDIWVGINFRASSNVLMILLPGYLISLAQAPSIQLLFSLEKHYLFGFVSILEGVANLILSLILIHIYGIYGVALGTAIPMLIIKTFFQPWYVCRVAKISLGKYYQSMGMPLLCSAGFMFIAYGFSPILIGKGWLSLLYSCSLVLAIYAVFSFRVLLPKGDKIRLINILKKYWLFISLEKIKGNKKYK